MVTFPSYGGGIFCGGHTKVPSIQVARGKFVSFPTQNFPSYVTPHASKIPLERRKFILCIYPNDTLDDHNIFTDFYSRTYRH